MSVAAALDDNMIPGGTYTFQLSLDNLITHPSTSTIQRDLVTTAPSFVSNDLQIMIPPTLNPFSNVYNVQFTYNGDGSDVISDVAGLIISAIKQTSNDDFSLVAAYADSAGNVSSGGVLDTITGTITDTTGKVTQQLSKSTQDILTPVEIAVGIVAVLLIALIFTAGKSGGASAGPEGVRLG